jgi:hypothetical protein
MFLVWSSEGGWNGNGYVLHMGRLVMQTKLRSEILERKRQCGGRWHVWEGYFKTDPELSVTVRSVLLWYRTVRSVLLCYRAGSCSRYNSI